MVKRYLGLVSLKEAKNRIRSFQIKKRTELVSIEHLAGRITAEPIFARFSVPELHLSAMDGIAVQSSETIGAGEQNPVTLKNVKVVNTGNVVPSGYDAVIMIEDVDMGPDSYTIRAAASPWQHIRPVGEDIAESEMIMPAGHKVRSFETGALVSYGISEVEVLSLKTGLIPTGSELVDAGIRPAPGQVPESNMQMAASVLQEQGIETRRYDIVPDDRDKIRDAVKRGISENDVLIISAGSSKGTRDYTAGIIEELGEVFIHGVAIKPAKPLIIGQIEGKPVICTPGYPLACYTILREIVTTLAESYGLCPPVQETISARLTTTLHSDIGTDEFVLLSVGKIGGEWVAVPQSRGAGVQMSLLRANAYMQIPSAKEGVVAGELVEVILMVPRETAKESLLITGSHDPVLDHLANMMKKNGIDLHSTHTGSMGGLLTLKKGQCHAAPMHLLSDNGEYNIEFLKKYMPNEELVLLCVAEREQGVVSRDGLSFDDITTHTFVNRQKGSGTRLLLDYLLRQHGIDSSEIRGYEREFTTHSGVALAVRTGEADCGICVYSTAKALGLNFVPIGTERYELVTRKKTLEEDSRVAALFDTIASEEFKAILTRLGGYDTRATGVRRELP